MTISIEYTDAQTGKPVSRELPEPPASFFDTLRSEQWSERQLETLIDRLDISADSKAQLAAFAKITMKVGREVVRIGRKIVDVLFSFLRSFPGIGFGVLFGLVIGALLGAIPLLGAVLGPVALTLGTALGVVLGANVDLKDPEFSTRLQNFIDELRPLAA